MPRTGVLPPSYSSHRNQVQTQVQTTPHRPLSYTSSPQPAETPAPLASPSQGANTTSSAEVEAQVQMKKLEAQWEADAYIVYAREVMIFQLGCLLQDIEAVTNSTNNNFLKVYEADHQRPLFPPPSLYLQPLDHLKTKAMDHLVYACREGTNYIPGDVVRLVEYVKSELNLDRWGNKNSIEDWGEWGGEVDMRLVVARRKVEGKVRKAARLLMLAGHYQAKNSYPMGVFIAGRALLQAQSAKRDMGKLIKKDSLARWRIHTILRWHVEIEHLLKEGERRQKETRERDKIAWEREWQFRRQARGRYMNIGYIARCEEHERQSYWLKRAPIQWDE